MKFARVRIVEKVPRHARFAASGDRRADGVPHRAPVWVGVGVWDVAAGLLVGNRVGRVAPMMRAVGDDLKVYLYVGRRFDTVKILYWHRSGFVVWHKVIDSEERFHWPRLLEEEVITLSTEQLNWLIDGYDIWTQPHKMLRFAHAS